jgi:hypothetical protein
LRSFLPVSPAVFGSLEWSFSIPFDHSIGFDKDDWPNMADSTWGTNIYKHYGYTPYWEEVSVKTSTATKTAA